VKPDAISTSGSGIIETRAWEILLWKISIVSSFGKMTAEECFMHERSFRDAVHLKKENFLFHPERGV
jgi:hypothetical protein